MSAGIPLDLLHIFVAEVVKGQTSRSRQQVAEEGDDRPCQLGAFCGVSSAEKNHGPQEGFLFSSFAHGTATVADNIRFGHPEATRAEVEAAARAIGAEPVILELPDGYDTEVGERGALLSAGERQLVAFARAWLADPALLILDEATSSLDVATETRVTEAMRRLRQGRTTIVIAHRLSTVIEADQIAVIEDGRVVESGRPEELLDAGGRFADLYDRWLAGAA
jgi:ATP-binding cassette, subfamily B, bacterial